MVRTITLRQIGYTIKGEATLNLWGGGEGVIPMKPVVIPELDTGRVLGAINDNGFGCESFDGAKVDIYRTYERGVEIYLKSVEFTREDLWGITNPRENVFTLARKGYETHNEPIRDDEE